MTATRTSRSAGVALSEIHPSVLAGVNDHDLDGLMALYADDASMVALDGSVVTGLDAIREQWTAGLAMGGTMELRSRYALEFGDLALLSNEWSLAAGDVTMSSVTAEVARRQPGGGWLYVVDHPFAGSEPNEVAAYLAATAGVTA